MIGEPGAGCRALCHHSAGSTFLSPHRILTCTLALILLWLSNGSPVSFSPVSATASGGLPLRSPISPSPTCCPARPVLSLRDRTLGAHAARLAASSPEAAIRWLRIHSRRTSVLLGSDRRTLSLRFPDRGSLVILPPGSTPLSISLKSSLIDGGDRAGSGVSPAGASRHQLPYSLPAQVAARRALVLEPFATELQLGSAAGQPEIDALHRAGFQVDVLRDAQVTVAALLHLSDYSVVYWDTHSGALPDGDAVVVTGETDPSPYRDYYAEHSLVQAFVAGDPSMTLYNGITGDFIDRHLHAFPAGALMFLNGCSILSAPLFWADLQKQNLAALISWDQKAQSTTNERAAELVFSRLEAGATVAQAVEEARTEGLGISIVDGTVATLGYRGWGDETLRAALDGTGPLPSPVATATPTPQPTATATPTPAPHPLAVHVSIAHHSIRAGHRQTITVRVAQRAKVEIAARYPGRRAIRHTAISGARGIVTWAFDQPQLPQSNRMEKVQVVVQVNDGDGARVIIHRSYRVTR